MPDRPRLGGVEPAEDGADGGPPASGERRLTVLMTADAVGGVWTYAMGLAGRSLGVGAAARSGRPARAAAGGAR